MLVGFLSMAAAFSLQATSQTPETIVNEQETPFVLSLKNFEIDPVNVSSVVVSLRSVGKDYKKSYANFSKPVNTLIQPGTSEEISISHTFSVPTKKYDVLLIASNGTHSVATEQTTVQFKDPEVSAAKALSGAAIVVLMVAAIAALVASILRPEYFDFLEAKKPKQTQQQSKAAVRERIPDAPDAWLPEKHKKKQQ